VLRTTARVECVKAGADYSENATQTENLCGALPFGAFSSQPRPRPEQKGTLRFL
jgi:hypothetical protein